MITKYCPKCQERKAATATYFYRDSNSKDGLFIWCQLCSKTYVTDRNRAKGIKERPKRNLAMQKAHRAEYDQTYHAAHREQRNEERRQKRLEQKALQPPKPPKAPRQPQPKRERQKPAPVVLATETQRHIDYFLNAKAVRETITLRGYAAVMKMFGQYLGDVWPPTADDINGFLAAAKKRGCSDTTLFNYWRLLGNWFNWLTKRGKLADNPISLTERPALPKKLPRAPKEEDIKRLFAQLRIEATDWLGVRNLALITLSLDSGMRPGEVVNLTMDDLDFERRRIIVRETKTDRERYVVLSDRALQVLNDWRNVRPTVDSDRLFISRRLNNLTRWGGTQLLRKALKRAGAKHFTPHQLRHAYAVYSLGAGAKLGDIQKQLGHTNIATTARYLLVTDDDDRVNRHGLTSPVNGLFGGAL